LSSLVEALVLLHEQFKLPVLCSLHPRTRSKAKQFGINLARTGLNFLEPFGFFDFIRLQQAASCVLSDSGTVQEETCILGVPSVTIRDVTERPETIECGSNVLAGNDAQTIVKMVHMVTRQKCPWVSYRRPGRDIAPSTEWTSSLILLAVYFSIVLRKGFNACLDSY
jgi:UDP-N-acetylglucosamine 2-epimerase (non-hydrolysing)